jgi:hypothetical protein
MGTRHGCGLLPGLLEGGFCMCLRGVRVSAPTDVMGTEGVDGWMLISNVALDLLQRGRGRCARFFPGRGDGQISGSLRWTGRLMETRHLVGVLVMAIG